MTQTYRQMLQQLIRMLTMTHDWSLWRFRAKGHTLAVALRSATVTQNNTNSDEDVNFVEQGLTEAELDADLLEILDLLLQNPEILQQRIIIFPFSFVSSIDGASSKSLLNNSCQKWCHPIHKYLTPRKICRIKEGNFWNRLLYHRLYSNHIVQFRKGFRKD